MNQVPYSARPLVLASASPRRAELLTSAGFHFIVRPADVDETLLAGEPASEYVLRVAQAKAETVGATIENLQSIILAADTAVVIDETILGKPRDQVHAEAMLKRLSGATHQVLTGVVIRRGNVERGEVVSTRVRFVPLTSVEVEWYLASGEYQGKAGGYAIQGRAARFIDWIEGSWSNVVGLPLAAVHRLLTEITKDTA